jgi:CheY-like chemotaxis protein
MPICDGLEAAVAIRARLKDRCPPIIALTASTSDDEKQRCVDAGMVGHLSKPIKAQQLGVLHELVAASRRKQQPPGGGEQQPPV